MSSKTKFILRAMAKHFGLQIRYVSYLEEMSMASWYSTSGVSCLMLKNPVTNTSLRFSMSFSAITTVTLPDDIASLIRGLWKFVGEANEWPTGGPYFRRCFRYFFNTRGKELDADLWAFCAFMLIAKPCGCRQGAVSLY